MHKLENVLETLGINRGQLAAALGIHRSNIDRWGRNKGEIPEQYEEKIQELLDAGPQEEEAEEEAEGGGRKRRKRKTGKKRGARLIALIGPGEDVIKALSKLNLEGEE